MINKFDKMGYKNVCLLCRVAFSEGGDSNFFNTEKECPTCHQKMIFVNQKFKPPKKSDVQAWKMVELLLENGFFFQSVYEKEDGDWAIVHYPKTLSEAQEFIKEYKFLPNSKIFVERKTFLNQTSTAKK